MKRASFQRSFTSDKKLGPGGSASGFIRKDVEGNFIFENNQRKPSLPDAAKGKVAKRLGSGSGNRSPAKSPRVRN
jgi:hypothetical protein